MCICEGCGNKFAVSKDIRSIRFCCEHCRRVYIGRKTVDAKRKAGTLNKQLQNARSHIKPVKDRTSEQIPGKCQFCGKECKNQNSLRNHERVCKLNPNRQVIETWLKSVKSERCKNQKWLDAVRQAGIKRSETYKPTIHRCQYCGREKLTSCSGEKAHERFCTMNPNKDVHPKKGIHLSEERKQYLRLRPGNGGIRKGAGHGKHGWYKGFWCDSSWELAYVIYCLDHNIKIERNRDSFSYMFNGHERKYYPDFRIGNEYIEIKNYNTPMVEAKISAFPKDKTLRVLYGEDLENVFSYVKSIYGENFIKLYESR